MSKALIISTVILVIAVAGGLVYMRRQSQKQAATANVPVVSQNKPSPKPSLIPTISQIPISDNLDTELKNLDDMANYDLNNLDGKDIPGLQQ